MNKKIEERNQKLGRKAVIEFPEKGIQYKVGKDGVVHAVQKAQ